jgi:hypothetical protein
MKNYNYYLIAGISIVLGILLSIIFSEGHFYTFFSLGICMILVKVYNALSDKKLFYYWKLKNFLIFWIVLILFSIILDRIGISWGYWIYPQFEGMFDEILKYVFEWGIALSYFGLFLVIGTLILIRRGLGRNISFIISLVLFISIVGLVTEYINTFSFSWKIISMPISNYRIGKFFIVFQTLGYWLMAVILLAIYKLADIKK